MKVARVLPFVLPVAAILSGCETPYKQTVVKLKEIKAPQEITQRCEMSKPMTKQAYLALNTEDREIELANFIVKLSADLKVCDSRLSAVRKYEEDVVKILSEADKK